MHVKLCIHSTPRNSIGHWMRLDGEQCIDRIPVLSQDDGVVLIFFRSFSPRRWPVNLCVIPSE
jgi:hypothetical protein